MKAKITRFLMSSYAYCLFVGLLMIVAAVWDIWADIYQYRFQVVVGFSTGLGLGLTIFFIEKRIYVRRSSRKASTQYKTTFLPLSVFFLLLLASAARPTSEAGLIFAFANGVYLLTLAVILFQIRKIDDVTLFS